MPHVWYFYALNKVFDVIGSQGSLKELLQTEITVETREANTGNDALRTTILQDTGVSVNKCVLFSNDGLETQAILAFTGDRNVLAIVLEWLKSVVGVVMYRINFGQSSMLTIADSMSSGGQCYSSKLDFDVVTENKNLTSMRLEIDKQSMNSLRAGSDRPYQDALVPYLYKETGMLLHKLPMRSISLAGHSKITSDTVTTMEDDLSHSTLQAILYSVQLPSA